MNVSRYETLVKKRLGTIHLECSPRHLPRQRGPPKPTQGPVPRDNDVTSRILAGIKNNEDSATTRPQKTIKVLKQICQRSRKRYKFQPKRRAREKYQENERKQKITQT